MLSLAADGSLTIERFQREEDAEAQADQWTILVYLCASDLESDYGLATKSLNEMAVSGAGENLRIIVEVGGAEQWQNDALSPKERTRFLIQNGSIETLATLPAQNMGEEETLKDFLRFALENYRSERMGLIFWDHGGGSTGGVCFDETRQYDSLSLLRWRERLQMLGFSWTGLLSSLVLMPAL